MTFKTGNRPWNLGRTGRAAGWTQARRDRISRAMTGHRGPRPHLWGTGPDPAVRRDRYRFLRSRCQARYLGQDWTITWTQYRALLARVRGQYGRDMSQLNLARRDCKEGWHIWNVHLITRREAMGRSRAQRDMNRKYRRPAC